MCVLLADRLSTGKPVVAKRLRQRIGTVMSWAVAQGYRENNPAGDAVGAVPNPGEVPRRVPLHGAGLHGIEHIRNSSSGGSVQ